MIGERSQPMGGSRMPSGTTFGKTRAAARDDDGGARRVPSSAPLLLVAAALGAGGLLPPAPSLAHDVSLGLTGERLEIKTAKGPKKQRVRVIGTGDAIDLAHDPAKTTSWLLVRGYGASGGTSGRIELDGKRWRTIGTRKNLKGYKYVDRAGRRGGVEKVLLRPGRLVIVAGGKNWPWQPSGPQDSVWVHFGIEAETLCASFGGTIERNEAKLFLASAATSPGRCPVAVCGNRKVELGENCDDGNLTDDDGCTKECAPGACVGEPFASTFDAIQTLVFERHGCTNTLCHGTAPGRGGLVLARDVAYGNLLEVPSQGSAFPRIEPAQPRKSALWLKLLKGLDPTATTIPGDPMPSTLPAIPENLLEAMRIWIEHGAPATGTVPGTQALLGGCYPDPVPISIAPLAPPDPEAGIQLEMPAYRLPPQTETEVCFATYYDVRDAVPARFKDPTNEFFYSRQDITRQDPHSHHLVILDSGIPDTQIHDPAYGAWTCAGGDRDGAACEPLDTVSCGAGICRSQVRQSAACIGYGPRGGSNAAQLGKGLGGAGNGQTSTDLDAGQYRRIPLKGIVYWNAHAFNLTSQEHNLKAYLNLLFTDDLEHEVTQSLDVRHIYVAAGQPPYTRETYCRPYTFPQGTRVVILSSHTHERGEAFWVNDPDGKRIYESFVYSDPIIQRYRPPLAFDSPDPARRTITYCATYNNGVAPDGSPDPSHVRRSSLTPQNAFPCKPTACADGLVGAPCNGAEDDVACDSVPGAGDGACDACPITLGVSTQDEMFVLTYWGYRVDLP
jgi:cysteine-rich repeat protein